MISGRPESAPRRFDTRFFVARMPVAQATAAHTGETTGEHWVSPGEALRAVEEGRWQMISPTTTTLSSLQPFADVESAFDAVAAETHLPTLTEDLSFQGMQSLR